MVRRHIWRGDLCRVRLYAFTSLYQGRVSANQDEGEWEKLAFFFLAPITKAHRCDPTSFHVHQRTRQIENVGLPLPLLLGKKSHQEVLPLGK